MNYFHFAHPKTAQEKREIISQRDARRWMRRRKKPRRPRSSYAALVEGMVIVQIQGLVIRNTAIVLTCTTWIWIRP